MITMNALERLNHYGIHPSAQRLAIMDYLLKNHTHPTVDDVYVALSKDMPTLSKTTVYNTLRLFAENGAALLLTIDERKVSFDATVEPHAHFFCKSCGIIYDLSDSFIQEQNEASFTCEGHDITESHYYYKGVCFACKKAQE